MKAFIHLILASVIASGLLSGCYNTVESQLYSGNYEEVLASSLKKLKNSKKRDQYLALAEKAYNNLFQDDKDKISRLKSGNTNGQNWDAIYDVYSRMNNRQRIVRPYLPLAYSNGSNASIELFDYTQVIEEARRNAADYHYRNALSLLEQPYKQAARDAYSELIRINKYYSDYKDASALINSAYEKGSNKVLLTFSSAYGVSLPPSYLNELTRYNYEREMDSWSMLYRTPADTSFYDLEINVRIEEISISPEYIRENNYKEEKTVQDGSQPLLDSEGNTVKDSLGNVIMVPRYTTLTCYVTEWSQSKTARVRAEFRIYNSHTGQLMVQQPLQHEVVFENCYARANGYLDILPQAVRSKLRQNFVPFPADTDLVYQTTADMQRQVASAIDRHDSFLAAL